MNAQQATECPTSSSPTPVGPPLRLVQPQPDTHSCSDESHPLGPDQTDSDIQAAPVGVDLPAVDHHRNETPGADVGGTSSTIPATASPIPIDDAPGWLELRIWAEMFHDAQQARIAATNRAERGGVDPTLYAAYLDSLAAAEHACGLAMRRCLRRVVSPTILAWQKQTIGIGEHQAARLLGHLGHPRIATPHHWEGTGSKRTLIADPPFERTVSQLWQFCGHGRPERKRKGMTADELAAQGNPTLKMLVHLIAEACMKQRESPYRAVYDDARAVYADRVHADECVRCGPSGRPAQPGSPWSAAHQHAAALRKVGKEILRDLWIISASSDPTIAVPTPMPSPLGPNHLDPDHTRSDTYGTPVKVDSSAADKKRTDIHARLVGGNLVGVQS